MPITTTLIGNIGGWQKWEKEEPPAIGWVAIWHTPGRDNWEVGFVGPQSRMYPHRYEIYVCPPTGITHN